MRRSFGNLGVLLALSLALAAPPPVAHAGGGKRATVKVKGRRLKRALKVFYRTRDSISVNSHGQVFHGKNRLAKMGPQGRSLTLARRKASMTARPGKGGAVLRTDLPSWGTDVRLEIDSASGSATLVETHDVYDKDRWPLWDVVGAKWAVNTSKLLHFSDRWAARAKVKEGVSPGETRRIDIGPDITIEIAAAHEHGPKAKYRPMTVTITRKLKSGSWFHLRTKRLWNPFTWFRSALSFRLETADDGSAPPRSDELTLDPRDWSIGEPTSKRFPRRVLYKGRPHDLHSEPAPGQGATLWDGSLMVSISASEYTSLQDAPE